MSEVCDVAKLVNDEWTIEEQGVWTYCQPKNAVLASCGWKVHVSSEPAKERQVIEAMRDVAFRENQPFKFLSTEERVRLSSAKGTPRTSSGKLACLYADNDVILRVVVNELKKRLRGIDGPDILTDVRCGDEPLFVRYGSFEEIWCYRQGKRVLGIVKPDGTVVPDEGRFRMTIPDWVDIPSWIGKYIDDRKSRGTNLPCGLKKALHYSNAGGVYLGIMRDTSEPVLVKEARPLTGYDAAGNDAIKRLRYEYELLEELSDTGVTPKPISFSLGTKHAYIIREYFEGSTLGQIKINRWPWHIMSDPSNDIISAYRDWASSTLVNISSLMKTVHDRGYAFQDLHLNNFFVLETGDLRIFDLEAFTLSDWRGAPPVAAPDCVGELGIAGEERDIYAFNILAHALFCPSVQGWATGTLETNVRKWIAVRFGSEILFFIDETVRKLSEYYGISSSSSTKTPNVDESSFTPLDRIREGFQNRITESIESKEIQDTSLLSGVAGMSLAFDSLDFAPNLQEIIRKQLEQSMHSISKTDLSLAHGSSGMLLALLLSGAAPDLDSWTTSTISLLKNRRIEKHLLHGVAGVVMPLLAAQSTKLDWGGYRELIALLADQLYEQKPGSMAGAGLLCGDAGLALFWNSYSTLTGENVDDLVRNFIAAPRAVNNDLFLSGGLEGIGGWFAALATSSDQIITEIMPSIEDALQRGIAHRGCDIAYGISGTLFGLALFESRFPGVTGRLMNSFAEDVLSWMCTDKNCRSGIFDPESRSIVDSLDKGTPVFIITNRLINSKKGEARWKSIR